jgi:hypothetical protein
MANAQSAGARAHTLGCTHGMIISKCVNGVREAMKFIINDRALCSQIYGLAAYQLRRLANHALQTRAPFIWPACSSQTGRPCTNRRGDMHIKWPNAMSKH